MSRSVVDLYPVYNIHIYLNRFKNIDLPYRGYYQVRVKPSVDGGGELDLRLEGGEGHVGDDSLLPPAVLDGCGLSRTIEVIYADEEFVLGDSFSISVRMSSVGPVKLTLSVELWYMDRNQPPRNDRFTMLNYHRRLLLSLSPSSCVAAARLLMWEYGSCATVSVGVVASLVSLLPRRKRESADAGATALREAHEVVVSSLLGSLRSLHDLIRLAAKYVKAPVVQESLEGREEQLRAGLQSASSPWKQLEADCVSLSAALSSLFMQTTQLCSANEGLFRHLSHTFNTWRSRRLAECFFSTERSLSSLASSPMLPLSALLALVSSTGYLASLPSHPLASPQLDFSASGLPFIFEEIFIPSSAPPAVSPPSPSSSSAASPPSPVSIVEYSPRKMEQLATYALQKEEVKKAVAGLLGREFRLLSESARCVQEPRASEGLHLVVFVHGLEGAGEDLWPYRIHLRRLLQGRDTSFLLSRANEGLTWGDVASLGAVLLKEVEKHVETLRQKPSRVSFVAHSLGGLIVRAAVVHEEAGWLRAVLHTFLSLNSPHLGLAYARATSHVGLTVVQWYKRSQCLAQLSLRDAPAFKDTYLVSLASAGSLGSFKNVLLLASSGDIMVPRHSALLASCPAAEKDKSSLGAAYAHMREQLHAELRECTVVRYHAVHRKAGDKLRGRPAHTACVEDSLFIEKLLCGSAVRYFF